LAECQSETGSGVRDAGAIHVQKHIVSVSEAGQGFDFPGSVNRGHFRRLRDGEDSRLHVMLVANPVIGVAYGFDGKLALQGGNRDELASGKPFGCAAFVGIDVGGLAADHGLIRFGERLEAEAIRRGAIENKKDIDAGAEVLLEFADRRLGVAVIPIADGMTLVDRRQGAQHLGMDAGVVVAGKAAGGFHS